MRSKRFRRRRRWQGPAWLRFGAPVAVLGVFFISKYAGLGIAPTAVALAVWFIVGALTWASHPAEPGEFR